jgi:ribosomal-protein-alanine N-acetyltransferase
MLEIRPITADDAESLLEFLGSAEVARWLRGAGQEGVFTRAECDLISARKAAHWTAHGFGTSLAFSDGRCVGWSILQHSLVAARGEVEIGWAVATALWGHGIATELGRHGLDSATAAGFERVVAFTRPDNLASRRVMEKLGLHYERDFTHGGLPHVLYATTTSPSNARQRSF